MQWSPGGQARVTPQLPRLGFEVLHSTDVLDPKLLLDCCIAILKIMCSNRSTAMSYPGGLSEDTHL